MGGGDGTLLVEPLERAVRHWRSEILAVVKRNRVWCARRSILVLMTASLHKCAMAASATFDPYPEPAIELLLTEPLRIPPGTAHITFQDGKIVGSADRYRPYCEFEVDTVSDGTQEIPPGRFQVSATAYRRLADELAGIAASPVLSWDCSEDVYYETRWRLRSRHYPGARVLICREVFGSCGAGRYPGPAEIREALGAWFELRYSAPSAR